MSSVKAEFETFLYMNLPAYDALSDGDKLFFDKLFKVLIKDGQITWSNSKLAAVLIETESTLEKRLKRIEDTGLIIRETSRICEFGKWRTVDRIISLNPDLFPFNYNSTAHNLFLQWMYIQSIEPTLDKILEMDYEEFQKKFGKVFLK